MAYILPNLSTPTLLQLQLQLQLQHKDRSSIPLHPLSNPTTLFPHTNLPRSVAQVNAPPSAHDKQQDQDQRNDFNVNLGLAVRTLREDLPLVFTKDLNYDIYRQVQVDLLGIEIPRQNSVQGNIVGCVEGLVWQPSENMILIRWNLKGVPRVPWEAKGEFQGTSRYKLDRNGKIYEHKVDNLAFNFPQPSVLDMVVACPATPNPTFLWGAVDDAYSCTWVEFYRAVKGTLDQPDLVVPQDCFAACL